MSCRPGAEFADIAHLASGTRGRAEVLQKGDMEGGMWWAGQAQGLIDSIMPCKAIISEIVAEAETTIHRLTTSVEPSNVGQE